MKVRADGKVSYVFVSSCPSMQHYMFIAARSLGAARLCVSCVGENAGSMEWYSGGSTLVSISIFISTVGIS